MSTGSPRRRWLVGMAFLLPNIAGFCAFTLVPLALAVAMAFSDWDILRHNVFRHEPLAFVGLDNFSRLLRDPQFWQYLGNTLFMMLGLPFAIAGSLASALLLTRVNRRRLPASGWVLGVATLVFVGAALVLLAGGMAPGGVGWMFGGLALGVFVLGVATGGTAYRTLFYLPHFTAGVATFVLWKKLYDPHNGPVNAALGPVLDGAASAVRHTPFLFGEVLPVAAGIGAVVLTAWQLRRLRRRWHEGEIGGLAVTLGSGVPAAAVGAWCHWQRGWNAFAWPAAVAVLASIAAATMVRRRPWRAAHVSTGVATEFALAMLLGPVLVLLVAALALGPALPAAATAGFAAPNWLGDYGWAKPALMMMALWAAIGSNNMILYLAGLSNIPPELYEAAEMDGATAQQRFWHITWPQLAPITFFVSVMGIIYGLQGGFEMARAMTLGGPAGSTTTLSYYVFVQAFEAGRLGYAAAVSWIMFLLVFVMSLVNFRLGNRDAND
ncbi:ABC transporter permease subunit [Horticoccus luteus]|uniref:ABC transporter permease subunit n=1 Tax=Horticoccus luteus TaxID=2862869 RepID=A0A8F9XL41_9BACT|nr:sugar ABC transporter permease [Horticoccus luteus]QYM80318.1 ABC transporter permease subunit [Horticoccus luteus]